MAARGDVVVQPLHLEIQPLPQLGQQWPVQPQQLRVAPGQAGDVEQAFEVVDLRPGNPTFLVVDAELHPAARPRPCEVVPEQAAQLGRTGGMVDEQGAQGPLQPVGHAPGRIDGGHLDALGRNHDQPASLRLAVGRGGDAQVGQPARRRGGLHDVPAARDALHRTRTLRIDLEMHVAAGQPEAPALVVEVQRGHHLVGRAGRFLQRRQARRGARRSRDRAAARRNIPGPVPVGLVDVVVDDRVQPAGAQRSRTQRRHRGRHGGAEAPSPRKSCRWFRTAYQSNSSARRPPCSM